MKAMTQEQKSSAASRNNKTQLITEADYLTRHTIQHHKAGGKCKKAYKNNKPQLQQCTGIYQQLIG